jgi:hypothetical protein
MGSGQQGSGSRSGGSAGKQPGIGTAHSNMTFRRKR